MADEEKTEAPSAGSDPEPEATPEPEAKQGSDPSSGDAAAEATPEPADAGSDPSSDASDAETPRLTPKQLRKVERSKHSGEAKPARSVSDRAAERAEARKKAAAERRRYRARTRGRRGEPGEGTPPAEREPGAKKIRQGRVVSAKADKTITVRIDVARRHPQYEKVVRRSATLHAHDAENQANEGDTVRVVETRPMSRTKRWRLIEVVEKAR
ncbi:MAG: 30S ribosomal protein S17 [Solirubrobacterales bacterium]